MDSSRRSFSCVISASIRRSDSSSRSRCASIRNASRSCSPTWISASSMTDRSMDTLYFDSTSSSEEVVCRACLSMSSLATSMSRSLSCNDRCWSRNVVISFCRPFCTVLASALDCLYFVCRGQVSDGLDRNMPESPHLPFLHLEPKTLDLLLELPLALLRRFDVLFEFGLELSARRLKLGQLMFQLLILALVVCDGLFGGCCGQRTRRRLVD